MEITEKRLAIIPCAGKATRMGMVNIPKCLYEIKGKPALLNILERLDSYFSYFYIPISDEKNSEELFKKNIPSSYLKKIKFIKSISGSGDGQAVLDALEVINQKKVSNHVFVCWGDSYFEKSPPLKDLINFIEKNFDQDLIIPTQKVINPYVTYFSDKENNLLKVAFSRRGEYYKEGLTDLSIFFIKPIPIQKHLLSLKTSQRNSLEKELNFLDLVELLFSLKTPAKTLDGKPYVKVHSFNTVDEAREINDKLPN